MEILFNVIGVVGTAFILIAYFLQQTEKGKGHSPTYNLLNLFGALFIMISLYQDWNLPAFVIEICWMAISLYAIYKNVRAKC